jgi:hypothetical protein
MVARSLVVATSHNLSVPLESAEPKVLPSGENARAMTMVGSFAREMRSFNKSCSVLGCFIVLAGWHWRPSDVSASAKKAGVVEGPGVLNHAGLLFDGPPGLAGMPFV